MLPCVLSDRARQVRKRDVFNMTGNKFVQVLSRTGLYLGLIIYAAVGGKVSSYL